MLTKAAIPEIPQHELSETETNFLKGKATVNNFHESDSKFYYIPTFVIMESVETKTQINKLLKRGIGSYDKNSGYTLPLDYIKNGYNS